MIGIYKITNKNNGKVYIGQSNDIERRFNEHKKIRSLTIDDYINVLGADQFDFEILEECSLDDLDQKEQDYIKKYNSKENGYNNQLGGYNNSKGEGNGRALLTEKDVEFIRQSYAEHKSQKQIYETYFKDKITKSAFQGVWQGYSWKYIMPEVYTEENKNFYKSGINLENILITKEELLEYRKYYINHTYSEVYEKLVKEKGQIFTQRTFQKILMGDVRQNSYYSDVPIYKKTLKRWELNGKPVSTISETGEQGY